MLLKKRLTKLFFLILLIPINSTESVGLPVTHNTKSNDVLISQTKLYENENIVKVETSGRGNTIEKAVQDAGVNALKQVAGSFIDSETFFKNKIEIKNSLINKTKTLNRKVRDYSQGTIKKYEILNYKKDGSFYNVTVKFYIRLEEFKTYVKKLGYGSRKIKKGLFAKILSENKGADNKIGFFKKIVSPLNEAEVVDINVGEPISVREFIAPPKKEQETVIVEGFGTSIDSAVQNAAFNALTQVVGSFIDAETYLKFKQEITNGIYKKSKEFSYDVKEFSKGSITLFEIISKRKEDDIYKITSKVTVGLNDFKSYINDLLTFGSNIGSYSDSLCMRTFGYDEICNKDFSFFTRKNLYPDSTILIPFELSLTNGYLENTEKILREISSENITIEPSPFSSYNFLDFDSSQDHVISIIDLNGEKPIIRKYVLDEAKSTLYKLKGGLNKRKSQDEVLLYGISCRTKDLTSIKTKNLEIRFLDGYGNTIKKINPSCLSSYSKGVFNIFESPIKNLYNNPISETPWMSLYTRTDECLANTNSSKFELCETQIITKRYFWLAFQVENFEILNEISEIAITFID